jgi:primary-amine oxidase
MNPQWKREIMMSSEAATAARALNKHPLAPLTADEIDLCREICITSGLVRETTRVAYMGLEEPSKADVARWTPGASVEREARLFLLDMASGRGDDVILSLTTQSVVRVRQVDPKKDGQLPIVADEFELVDEIVKADHGWRASMEARGIVDLSLVRPCPLSAGAFGIDGESGRRMLRVLSFLAHRNDDHCWAHPIDGVVAYVDLTERRVLKLVDHEKLPIPEEEGNFDDREYVGPARTTLRPIEISQPDGPSFNVNGYAVAWEGWTFRVGFDQREGLVLHELAIDDRPIIYRASVAEMVVPYADPGPVRFWQNYFDAGEYKLGEQVNELTLGCDCLGEIHYFNAVLTDQFGHPQVRRNAICMHEEDFGVLWKHTDLFTESQETRRQRRLVISFFVTVGNYDYGFYWYLYLDGTIEFECKVTGVLFASAYPPGREYASEVAPGLGAPFHQHLFSVRLDMAVDGLRNAVDEVDLVQIPISDHNPYGGAFSRSITRLVNESGAARSADPLLGRHWIISSADRTNRLGRPTAFALYPQGQPVLAADPSSSIAGRAAFATKHLWVTAYDRTERYSAGDLPNQHPGQDGLPAYAARGRSIDGEDVVVWHTLGLTHFPRPEDWPVMPVDRCGFTLKPVGFFDRNPALDVPASIMEHCATSNHDDRSCQPM